MTPGSHNASLFLARRAKKLKRSASSVLSEIVAEAAQMEARDHALAELGESLHRAGQIKKFVNEDGGLMNRRAAASAVESRTITTSRIRRLYADCRAALDSVRPRR